MTPADLAALEKVAEAMDKALDRICAPTDSQKWLLSKTAIIEGWKREPKS